MVRKIESLDLTEIGKIEIRLDRYRFLFHIRENIIFREKSKNEKLKKPQVTRNELCGLGSEPLGLIYRDESYRDDLTPPVSSASNAVINRTDLPSVEKPKERRKHIIKARVART